MDCIDSLLVPCGSVDELPDRFVAVLARVDAALASEFRLGARVDLGVVMREFAPTPSGAFAETNVPLKDVRATLVRRGRGVGGPIPKRPDGSFVDVCVAEAPARVSLAADPAIHRAILLDLGTAGYLEESERVVPVGRVGSLAGAIAVVDAARLLRWPVVACPGATLWAEAGYYGRAGWRT